MPGRRLHQKRRGGAAHGCLADDQVMSRGAARRTARPTDDTVISRWAVEGGVARRRDKGEEKRIVQRRIRLLLERAEDEAGGPDADLAPRYTDLARRIARRYQMPLVPDQKARLCRKCGAYRTGDAARVRVHRGRLITTCLQCGHIHRRPLGSP